MFTLTDLKVKQNGALRTFYDKNMTKVTFLGVRGS
jgi:hypothetical protein